MLLLRPACRHLKRSFVLEVVQWQREAHVLARRDHFRGREDALGAQMGQQVVEGVLAGAGGRGRAGAHRGGGVAAGDARAGRPRAPLATAAASRGGGFLGSVWRAALCHGDRGRALLCHGPRRAHARNAAGLPRRRGWRRGAALSVGRWALRALSQQGRFANSRDSPRAPP